MTEAELEEIVSARFDELLALVSKDYDEPMAMLISWVPVGREVKRFGRMTNVKTSQLVGLLREMAINLEEGIEEDADNA